MKIKYHVILSSLLRSTEMALLNVEAKFVSV